MGSKQKQLLIIDAGGDIPKKEVDQVCHVANLLSIEVCKQKISSLSVQELKSCIPSQQYDYIYLAAHANRTGFGEKDGPNSMDWESFAQILCDCNCLNDGVTLFLGCCRGGLKSVALKLFQRCERIDYICGPRWDVTPVDICAAFHVFLYNLENRKVQPSTAVERASNATGFDFFCHDRIETEDENPYAFIVDPCPACGRDYVGASSEEEAQ